MGCWIYNSCIFHCYYEKDYLSVIKHPRLNDINLFDHHIHSSEMSSGEEVKNILYSTIKDIGKERIRFDTTSDINLSEKYIDTIMSRCTPRINSNSKINSLNETLARLSEALLHFMLTVCTLPSERKIQVKEDLMVDVVIPNLLSLKRNSRKSIIIEIIKNKEDLAKIPRLEYLQPDYRNIWVVTPIPLSAKRYRTYSLTSSNGTFYSRFSNIIIDIDDFLRDTGDRSLRLIH